MEKAEIIPVYKAHIAVRRSIIWNIRLQKIARRKA